MKNQIVYLVEYADYDEYTLNSIWTDRKLAEKGYLKLKKE